MIAEVGMVLNCEKGMHVPWILMNLSHAPPCTPMQPSCIPSHALPASPCTLLEPDMIAHPRHLSHPYDLGAIRPPCVQLDAVKAPEKGAAAKKARQVRFIYMHANLCCRHKAVDYM